jgi:hypothetical protein
VRVRIEREPGSGGGSQSWRIIDADQEPGEHNYGSMLAFGCQSLSDALACAVEHGWIVGGGDSPGIRPTRQAEQ